MSLLELTSSKTLFISNQAFVNTLIASTINASNITAGNLLEQASVTSSITGLGTAGYVSTLSLVSSLVGLGSITYISSPTLISTTGGLQREYQTAGFLSGPNLLSTVGGLGNARYISTSQLTSTVAGLGNFFVSSAVLTGADLNSTVIGISRNFTVSSLNVSSMNKVLIRNNPANIIHVVGGSLGGTTIRYSLNNGSTWSSAASGDFTSQAEGIGYNGTYWVACGSGGATLKWSLDGSNWSNAISGSFTTSGLQVAWNGTMWVASGAGGGTLKYSFDGSNWLPSASGEFTTSGGSIAWNGNMWVAIGDDTTAAYRVKYSYDGSNWLNKVTGNTISIAYRGNQVAFGKNLWVIVGSGNTCNDSIQYSRDGFNWTSVTSNGFDFNNAGINVCYNGSIWVASGYDNTGADVRYSYNGINWSKISALSFGTGLVWTGVSFVALANSSPPYLFQSFDGINWTTYGNSVAGSGSGRALGVSSNVIPAYQQNTLQILNNNLYYTNGSWNSTCIIVPQYGTLNVNDTLIVNRALSRVGINSNFPRFSLDVEGDAYASTFLTNSVSTIQLNTSSILLGGGAGWVTIGALQTVVTSSIQVNSALAYISSLYCGSTNTALPFYTARINGTALVSSLLVGQPQDTFSTIGFRLAITHDSAVKPGTTTWTTTSDMRVKENIIDADYDRCYSDIKSVKLRRFEWMSSFLESWGGTDKHVLGFVAQEVSTIIPKSVRVENAYGYPDFHFLNINQLNMSLYGAVKRTIQDKEALESTVVGQRVEIETLKGMTVSILSTVKGLQP